jgi:hypothetical protein
MSDLEEHLAHAAACIRCAERALVRAKTASGDDETISDLASLAYLVGVQCEAPDHEAIKRASSPLHAAHRRRLEAAS